MTSIKEVRNKITSIKNTQQITQSMAMVAASKMRKTQTRMLNSRIYTEKTHKIINEFSNVIINNKHPYLNKRKVKCIGYLVISSDRGLAGSLNSNLFKTLLEDISHWKKKRIKVELALIGAKAVSFFNSVEYNVCAQITGITDQPILSELTCPLKVMLKAYDGFHLDKIYIVSNKFINTMLQIPRIVQILPFQTTSNKEHHNKKIWDYIYESDSKTLLDNLLHRYLESQVYQGILENIASEQAARMVAMKSATDNSSSLINDLQLIYNKARQSRITQELTEIVSGADAV